MAGIRKPFQGIWNIIRFNWHFYALAFGIAIVALSGSQYLPVSFRIYPSVISILILVTSLISLLVSMYVYDFSSLYKMTWLNYVKKVKKARILNIHAGFDETSQLLNSHYPDAGLTVFDFYDPAKHTEVSIKRARKVYPPYPNTRKTSTTQLPLDSHTTDIVFILLSAHEIREESERQQFFHELRRVLKPSGQIVIVEHLRNLPNFIAYTIGFFHFIPQSSWLLSFQKANLHIVTKKNITPFITLFILENGNPS
ncbi:methyltransferase domain-containing protein [Rapidithrix thailandica]|uniref:Methyltransferase domain-containing protein n=1 Tax=Rapidithrix thailandica TaxID=413964 RepID=A0AAW9S853_9BACT